MAGSNYEFRIKGRLSHSLAEAFQDLTTSTRPAETVIRGELRDLVELHAVLERIRAVGLELIALRYFDEEEET